MTRSEYMNYENTLLKGVLSEVKPLQCVTFHYGDGCHYHLDPPTIGACCASDLLCRTGLGFLQGLSSWEYYLYPNSDSFKCGIDGLCGEAIRKCGKPISESSAHLFVCESCKQVKIVYVLNGEYRLEHRRLSFGRYQLLKKEKKSAVSRISQARINIFLTAPKEGKARQLN